MKQLPPFLGKEIFQFLLPSTSDIEFELPLEIKYRSCRSNNYNKKYQMAFYKDKKLANPTNTAFLSRIPKKNGKHRYYITWIEKEESEWERGDRQGISYTYLYESMFVGHHLEKALITLSTLQ